MAAETLSRRAEYVAATRAAILSSAAELFAGQGFEKTSIDQVALAARISKGAIYHHFPDKRTIFEAIFLTSQEQTFADVLQVASLEADPVRRVEVALHAFIEQYAGDPHRRALLREAPTALGPERMRAYDEKLALPLLRATLDSLPGRESLTDSTADVAARLLLAAMCEAATGLAIEAETAAAKTDEAAQMLIRMVHGLLRWG
jgi:AcrR family transcriptional regulator